MPNPNASSLADPQVLTRFEEELARAYPMPALAPTGAVLWPQFAGYYQGLARLPRRLRRALQRQWRRSLGGIALLCALGQAPALAATISVDGTTCTLVDAITAANSNAPAGGCTAGSGADRISLPVASTHTLTTHLPIINSEITIDGGGFVGTYGLVPNSTITRNSSAPEFGILSVGATGNLTLEGTTVSGGNAGSGGGIRNSGILTLSFCTISGNTAPFGGGIDSPGTVTLTNSTISGNTALLGGGILGYATLINSTISGNTALRFGGGIDNRGSAFTLTDSTISDNSAGASGGGVANRFGTLTVTNSMLSGNQGGTSGGGIYNSGFCPPSGATCHIPTLTLTNSTVSGDTAGTSGGGVTNGDLLTLTNSTISGNTAADRGGAVENSGTVTLTNSTVSRNASGRVAGGVFNTGTVTLVQSLLSGNTAPVIGPEAYSISGNVIGDSFNVFGHDGFSGVAGFTLGATDLVPAVSLSAILEPTIGYNGGPTKTHTLVFGSPAVDTIPGAACATGTDQRGAPRPQDADGDTFADCDSGSVERGLIPIQAEITNTTLDCNSAACRVSVKCNLQETECTNPIDIAVRTRALRASDGTLVKASKLIRFAAGATNVPPGGTQQLRVKLTKPGKRLVRATKKRRLKGVLGIQEIAATVSNTPLTISRTNVTIRLKRPK